MSTSSKDVPTCTNSPYLTAVVVLISINVLLTFIAVTLGYLYYAHRAIKITPTDGDTIDSNEDAVCASGVDNDQSSA